MGGEVPAQNFFKNFCKVFGFCVYRYVKAILQAGERAVPGRRSAERR